MSPAGRRTVRHVAASPAAIVLVCRKCSRKLRGGFGPDGDQRLAKLLRRAARSEAGAKAGRKPRRAALAVLEVGCLDLCPKEAVVVLRGDRPGDWLVVPRGTPVGEVGAALGLPGAPIREEA